MSEVEENKGIMNMNGKGGDRKRRRQIMGRIIGGRQVEGKYQGGNVNGKDGGGK